MDLTGVATFTSLDEMLAGCELDLVDVTLPPALHADATVKALSAGKHVFCEKPLSLRLEECERMSAAASSANKHLYVGHVLPFFPEYAWAYEAARSGHYGALRGGAFRRVISDPAWLPHFWKADAVGGPLFDLHVHDAHFIRLLFGMPHNVVSHGRTKNGLPEFWHTFFSFAGKDLLVQATSGTVPQQGRAFNHGFEIHFEKATLLFEFAVIGGEAKYLCPPTILDESGNAERVNLGAGDPMDSFEAELRNVIESVRKNQESEILSSGLAMDAVRLCQMQADSIGTARQAASRS
jgi:predicted dehydrogenase